MFRYFLNGPTLHPVYRFTLPLYVLSELNQAFLNLTYCWLTSRLIMSLPSSPLNLSPLTQIHIPSWSPGRTQPLVEPSGFRLINAHVFWIQRADNSQEKREFFSECWQSLVADLAWTSARWLRLTPVLVLNRWTPRWAMTPTVQGPTTTELIASSSVVYNSLLNSKLIGV